MRVVRLIPVTSIYPPTSIKLTEAVKIYFGNLPGNTLHVVLDHYLPGDENRFLKKCCPEIIAKHKIPDLRQQYTKSDE